MRPNRTRTLTIDRRAAGIAVLILAMVAAIVVGTRNDRSVAGRPTPSPVADPPRVGDCLTGPLAADTYPALGPTGPCDEQRYGEVIAVLPHSLPQVLDPEFDGSTDDLTSPDAICVRKGMQFMGLSFPPVQGLTPDPPTWFPAASVGPGLIQPNPLAQRFGADWTACVVSVYSNLGGSTVYTGTLARVHVIRDYPPNAAICWPDPVLNENPPVSCRQPHVVEEFGSMWDVNPSVEPAALQDSCVDLVKAMTGMADPTAAGALQIRVVRTSTYQASDDQDTVLAAYGCIVQADLGKLLTGPLLGLRDGPLPLH